MVVHLNRLTLGGNIFKRHVRRKGSSINGLCSCGINWVNCPLLALWYDSGLALFSCEARGDELELALVERGILAAARMQGNSILPLDTNWRLLDINIVAYQPLGPPPLGGLARETTPFLVYTPRSHTTTLPLVSNESAPEVAGVC